MLRRILVLAGIVLALVVGGRHVSRLQAERAFERRTRALLEQALRQPAVHRPWKSRFEALEERLRTSPRFGALIDSEHRPFVAWGGAEPRRLDESEVLWVEAAWTELGGLESTLVALRALAPAELAWNGETLRLHVLRECVNALCARAWLAVERGDDGEAARVYADALRLCMATDDGTTMGLMIRTGCANTALASARSALALGLSARALGDALRPLLRAWEYRPEHAERRIRRDLAVLLDFEPPRGEHDERAPLEWVAPVEEALAIARLAAPASPWARDTARSAVPAALEPWTLATRELHATHARRNVALTALAVAAFREEHGSWPDSLRSIADLAEEECRDPLSGAPLPYSWDDQGALIGPASFSWGDALHSWLLRAARSP